MKSNNNNNRYMSTLNIIAIISMILFCAEAVHAHGRTLNKLSCYKDFKAKAQKDLSFEALKRLVKTLTKKDLRCLYKETEIFLAPKHSFFIPVTSHSSNEMAVIFGKNSLPFLNTFEKHVLLARPAKLSGITIILS